MYRTEQSTRAVPGFPANSPANFISTITDERIVSLYPEKVQTERQVLEQLKREQRLGVPGGG